MVGMLKLTCSSHVIEAARCDGFYGRVESCVNKSEICRERLMPPKLKIDGSTLMPDSIGAGDACSLLLT